MFSTSEEIQKYHVYQYQHIDYLFQILSPYDINKHIQSMLPFNKEEELDDVLNAVHTLFKSKGWEGDGEIGVIWIPPFISLNTRDESETWGSFLWHVKQSNNGTSFIASKEELHFKGLKNKNEIFYRKKGEAIHILQDECEVFIKILKKKKADLSQEIEEINNNISSIKNQLVSKILGFTQCEIIADLNEFMEICYLNLLIEVLENGNRSNIKLRKSSVKIDLTKHNYAEIHNLKFANKESLNWLSFKSIISDIYHAFSFEPFQEKFSRLTKSLDYSMNRDARFLINKHVVIRNCIQHNDWQLESKSLKTLGADKITIKNIPKNIEIKEWKVIKLTFLELEHLIDSLIMFIDDFSSHVNTRILTRHYRVKK